MPMFSALFDEVSVVFTPTIANLWPEAALAARAQAQLCLSFLIVNLNEQSTRDFVLKQPYHESLLSLPQDQAPFIKHITDLFDRRLLKLRHKRFTCSESGYKNKLGTEWEVKPTDLDRHYCSCTDCP